MLIVQLSFLCRYGVELARLGQAQISAKKAFDIARRGGIATTVLQDINVSHLFSHYVLRAYSKQVSSRKC